MPPAGLEFTLSEGWPQDKDLLYLAHREAHCLAASGGSVPSGSSEPSQPRPEAGRAGLRRAAGRSRLPGLLPEPLQKLWRKAPPPRVRLRRGFVLFCFRSLSFYGNSAAFQSQPPGTLWASLDGSGSPHAPRPTDARPSRPRLRFPPRSARRPPPPAPSRWGPAGRRSRARGCPGRPAAASPFRGGSDCSPAAV